MKTKLVYVLTSSPEKNFIEQALLSIYTAKYYNQDACIILIVDDLTNNLFEGQRAEILQYISEKKVVKLDEGLPMPERSRWLKTNIREQIEGDFLYIDCDTIITGTLSQIDECTFEMAAVLDSNIPINQFHKSSYDYVSHNAQLIGWDITLEEHYFNSGVFLCKDTELTQLFFKKWHSHWLKGLEKGLGIDQPSFAMANIETGHLIQRLDNSWNCIMYTYPEFDKDAKILHFSSYKNMSYMFGKEFLEKVQTLGIQNDFVQFTIFHPYHTYLPFNCRIMTFGIADYLMMLRDIYKTSRLLSKYLNNTFDPYLPDTGIYIQVRKLFEKRLFFFGALLITLYKFYEVKKFNWRRKKVI